MKNPFAATHVFSNGRRAILASALALAVAAGAGSGPAFAQDGTGAATPTPPSACKVVPASATSPAASPVSTPVATSPATPASLVASPVVDLTGTPAPGATPVTSEQVTAEVDPLKQDLEASATAVTGCLTDGNIDTLSQITGGTYRAQLIGFEQALNPADFKALAASMPEVPYQIIAVEDASFTGDDVATATVTYEMAHQVRKGTWEFSLQEVQGTTTWVLERETPLMPETPEGTATVKVTIKDNAYTLKDETVTGPSVKITATNNDKSEHEVLVLRFEGDATTQTLLRSTGPSLPENVDFVGQVTIPAGESGTLLLSGLQPGTYTIVDMFPNAEGLPNLVEGMQATLKVE